VEWDEDQCLDEALQNDLRLLLPLENRLHQDRVYSSAIGSPDICEDLISYEDGLLLGCTQISHSLLIGAACRLPGLIDITIAANCLTETLDARLLIIREKDKPVSNLVETIR